VLNLTQISKFDFLNIFQNRQAFQPASWWDLRVRQVRRQGVEVHHRAGQFIFKFSIYIKDAGFVHESLRIETNRIFWDFWSYESKRIESFEIFGLTKRIHDTNP
jgi:hypothetical protein